MLATLSSRTVRRRHQKVFQTAWKAIKENAVAADGSSYMSLVDFMCKLRGLSPGLSRRVNPLHGEYLPKGETVR